MDIPGWVKLRKIGVNDPEKRSQINMRVDDIARFEEVEEANQHCYIYPYKNLATKEVGAPFKVAELIENVERKVAQAESELAFQRYGEAVTYDKSSTGTSTRGSGTNAARTTKARTS